MSRWLDRCGDKLVAHWLRLSILDGSMVRLPAGRFLVVPEGSLRYNPAGFAY
jgi:hypothetical protein